MTGCTLFVVDAGVDTGAIVAQRAVPVEDDDTVESLHERIKVAERGMLVDTVGRMARGLPGRGAPGPPRPPGWAAHDWRRWATTRSDAGSIDRLGAPPPSTQQECHREREPDPDQARPGLRLRQERSEDLVRSLHDAGVALVSTGGSAALIEGLGIPVTRVEDLTGFPECLDGRVKTLHPKVHAGILADRRLDSHVEQLAELGVEPFDLVVSNLYPFVQTVASGATPTSASSRSTSGTLDGPCGGEEPPVRRDRDLARPVRRRARRGRGRWFTLAERQRLAAEAFVHTATYDVAVASWMGNVLSDTSDGPAGSGEGSRPGSAARGTRPRCCATARTRTRAPRLPQCLRHRPRAGRAAPRQGDVHNNNYVDADAARRAAYDFDEPAVAIIKHANPCGIAVGADVAEAHRRAHACDPVSAFGGVIAVNRPVSVAMAERVAEVFTEVVVAPGYDDGAVEVLQGKKNIRILVCEPGVRGEVEMRPISGGLLMQQRDYVDAPG